MTSFVADENSPPKASKDSSAGSNPRELDPTSDEALLIHVSIHQSKAAFDQLFNRFASKVFAQGMKIMRNEQLAKDLVQEAMLTVWR
jgi:3-oxoacyl-ACP reductase-like protein